MIKLVLGLKDQNFARQIKFLSIKIQKIIKAQKSSETITITKAIITKWQWSAHIHCDEGENEIY